MKARRAVPGTPALQSQGLARGNRPVYGVVGTLAHPLFQRRQVRRPILSRPAPRSKSRCPAVGGHPQGTVRIEHPRMRDWNRLPQRNRRAVWSFSHVPGRSAGPIWPAEVGRKHRKKRAKVKKPGSDPSRQRRPGPWGGRFRRDEAGPAPSFLPRRVRKGTPESSRANSSLDMIQSG